MSTERSNFPSPSALSAIAALATASAVHAGGYQIYVDASAPLGGDGTSWNTAFRDLQDALTAARLLPCSEVRVADGVYLPDRGTGDRDMSFHVGSCMYLWGGFAGLGSPDPDLNDPARFVSVLSGDLARDDMPNFANTRENARTVVRTPIGGLSSFQGFTITGGFQDAHAGASAVDGGDYIVLRECRVVNNQSVAPGSSAIRSERFAYFQATLIAGNQAAGDILRSPEMYLIQTRAISNHAVNGGVFVAERSVAQPTWLRATNCIVASNRGSAVRVSGAGLQRVEHCTIVGNTSSEAAAILAADAARISVWNSIFWNNRNDSPSTPSIVGETGAIIDVYSVYNFLERGAAEIASAADPLLPFLNLPAQGDALLHDPDGPDDNPATWSDNDYRPRNNSPCVDAADTTSSTIYPDYLDIDGVSPVNVPRTEYFGFGPVKFKDIGAHELSASCAGDYLVDGRTSVEDLFAFIADWHHPLSFDSDLNADLQFTVEDLLEMVSRFFTPCDP